MNNIILKVGREKSLLRKHPWVFSGAIESINGEIIPGGTVSVYSSKKQYLGLGAYSPSSQIRIRMWTFLENENVDNEFIHKRVSQAIVRRKLLNLTGQTNAIRIIHSESDGLPGVIADQYGDTVVIQLLTNGAVFWRDVIFDAIITNLKPRVLIEKSDADVLKLEGLPERIETIIGNHTDPIQIQENGIQYLVNILNGQKTGFYLDQRDNRKLVRQYSDGKKVLDCFCFTGGFTANALLGGASHVTATDSSADAIQLVGQNCELNGLDPTRYTPIEANVFEYLRFLRDKREQFDLIILDPPKFAPTNAQVEKASRAYKDINMLALKLLNPGGILFSFSCSGGVNLDLFKKIVADAALDAGRGLQYIHFMHQAADHPISAAFPESEYLKGIVGSVL